MCSWNVADGWNACSRLNDLAENTRGAMINQPQARLADAVDLSTQTK